MTKFNINTYKFELDNEEYFLKPLSGAHIDLVFKVLGTFQDVNEKIDSEATPDMTQEEKEAASSAKFLKYLPQDSMKDLHDLTLATFKRSYPNLQKDLGITEEDLEGFITQNLFKLMSHVIKVNMNTTEE